MGPYFGMFAAIWIYLRHYINWRILWALLTEYQTVGPYGLNWETENYKCWISQVITFGLLASLQAVNLFWLYLIGRIAKSYVFAKTLADERSEAEDEPGEEDDGDGDEELDRAQKDAASLKPVNRSTTARGALASAKEDKKDGDIQALAGAGRETRKAR